MQDRYAGDVGDYVKYALLRHLSADRRLGVAWYRFPNESHNADGKHTAFLQYPDRWRDLDPELFDTLSQIVATGRSTAAIERSGILRAAFSREELTSAELPASARADWRSLWFGRTLNDLGEADLVFADLDNGLVDDGPHRPRQKHFGKQMPLSEAKHLARGRTAVLYHHNSRFKGGHDAEVDFWSKQLGEGTVAVRATAYNCRTFFIVNPDQEITERAKTFCGKWARHRVLFHSSGA